MNRKIKSVISIVIIVLVVGFVVFYLWERQPYYKKYHYIAHALGGIDDIAYTNSEEALQYAYSNGMRVFEVDFVFTSDKKLVGRHKWSNDLGDGFSEDNIPDHITYMSSKLYGKYTTIDIDTIINFAKKHSEVYFVTDLKSYKTEMSDMIESIQEAAERLDYQDYQEHIIIQFYNYDIYNLISDKYSFNNYIFTLYRMTDELTIDAIDNILDFCVANNIKVVTLPKKYVSNEIIKKIKDKDIIIYTHTINSREEWMQLKTMGVDGIYTDYIFPYNSYKLNIIIGTLIVCGIIGSVIGIIFYKNNNKRGSK